MRTSGLLNTLAAAMLLAGCGASELPVTSSSAWAETPPDGTRWVGMGQVVVAVPEWWSTGETYCLAPVETTVYFDEGATADCLPREPDAVREVSALAVLDGDRGYGARLIDEMTPAGEVAGLEVVERDGCERWFEGVCRKVFAVPAEGVVFAVTIHDEGDGDFDEIRDSLRVLPDRMTTVPLASADGWTPTWGAEPRAVDAVVRAVEKAGLRAEVVTAERPKARNASLVADLPKGSLLDVEPALGSVIEDGGTVTITISGPRPRR